MRTNETNCRKRKSASVRRRVEIKLKKLTPTPRLAQVHQGVARGFPIVDISPPVMKREVFRGSERGRKECRDGSGNEQSRVMKERPIPWE